MINPKIFPILNANAGVKTLLGTNPLRFFPWAEAPQSPVKPYAVYSVYSGVPENYLGDLPDMDRKSTQIDIFAESGGSCNSCFIAIRNALESYGHMVGFNTPVLDKDTKLYRATLDFEFLEDR